MATRTTFSFMNAIALGLILALLYGVVSETFIGVLTGALLGVLIGQVLHLRWQIKRLQQQLLKLQQSPEHQRPAHSEVAASPKLLAAGSRAEVSPPPAYHFGGTPEPRARGAKPSMPSDIELPIQRTLDRCIRWLIQGNPLARLGIVVLFLGAAFLAKYAEDRELVPIELRFIALAAGALFLLVIGWRLRMRRPVYAQLLQGGGVAGLYLTVFAATKLYQLLPFGLALVLMVATAVGAAILAVSQNALSLAVLSTTGGFLAPILVSDSDNHLAMFSYYAVLNVGVLTVAWFRTWRVLNVLGFLFTFIITGVWRFTEYDDPDRLSTAVFLWFYFVLYVSVSVLNCIRQPPDFKGYVSGSLVFGLPVAAFTLHASLVADIESVPAYSAAILGAFYLALSRGLRSARIDSLRLLIEAFAALGVIFLSLAVPLAFNAQVTATMWAIEGAGLFWLGVRQNRKLARASAILLQVAAGISFDIHPAYPSVTTPIVNETYLSALMLGVAGLFCAYWSERNQAQQASYESALPIAAMVWGTAWWFISGLHEIGQFAPAVLGSALAFAAVTAGMLAALAIMLRWSLAEKFALNLPAPVAITTLVYCVSLSHPFAQWGAVGWLLLFTAHYGMLYLADTNRIRCGGLSCDVLHGGAFWALGLLSAWEIGWQVGRHADGVWPALPWGLVPALMLFVTARSRPGPLWPLQRFLPVYRMLGAIPMVVAMGMWIIFVNLLSSGDPAGLPYLPLLNPLDISVALCLLASTLWWGSLAAKQQQQLHENNEHSLLAIVVAIIFLWLNAALIRTLHHNWGVPLAWPQTLQSNLVQASLSIFWGSLGFAAMVLAAKRKWRNAWMTGAVLMAVVVVKLFLVDLASVGTVARISSFLTVGILLLITGYLAPLPPRSAAQEILE